LRVTISCSIICFSYCSAHHRHLHSFPTRRSSDLTYRLTEHFHFWTKHCRLNAITQPEQFVEIGEALAGELGIAAGDRVKVSSNRGYIKAVAVVTKRLRPLTVDGRTVHQVGIPLHWGYSGL